MLKKGFDDSIVLIADRRITSADKAGQTVQMMQMVQTSSYSIFI